MLSGTSDLRFWSHLSHSPAFLGLKSHPAIPLKYGRWDLSQSFSLFSIVIALIKFVFSKMSSQLFLDAGTNYINRARSSCGSIDMRTFKSHFKLEPTGFEALWEKLTRYVCPSETTPASDLEFDKIQPSHLLWSMHYMYTYASGDVCASLFGVTRRTFFKYVWPTIGFLSSIHLFLVSFCCYLIML